MHFIIAIVTRSRIGSQAAQLETLRRLNLRRTHTMGVYQDSPSLQGMIKSCRGVVWTRVQALPQDLSLGFRGLNSPKGGFIDKIPRVGYVSPEQFYKGFLRRMIR